MYYHSVYLESFSLDIYHLLYKALEVCLVFCFYSVSLKLPSVALTRLVLWLTCFIYSLIFGLSVSLVFALCCAFYVSLPRFFFQWLSFSV